MLSVTLTQLSGWHPAEQIQEKMLFSMAHLKFLKKGNKAFEVRIYDQPPNFKILLFDNIMFVSAFVAAKNDANAKMFKMIRAGNPLFQGFERLFDELWKNAKLLE